MSTDHGFVIYHHWSVLSCKNTIRLPLVFSSASPLSVYHRAKCQVQHKNRLTIYGCPPVSVQDSDSVSEKTVVAELPGFVSSVSSGFDLWEFHTFAFLDWFVLFCCYISATPCQAGHTPPSRPLSFLLSPPAYIGIVTPTLLSCRFRHWLCRQTGTLLTKISCQLRQFHLNRWETKQWISHETNSNFACWMGLSRGGCIVGAAYPLPAPHIRLIISRAA